MKITKYIQSDDKINIKERYIYDINLNRYEIANRCKNRAFASLYYSSDNYVDYYVYGSPPLSQVLHDRKNNYDIICIRLRAESDFNARKLNKQYTRYKHAIISVSQ